MERWPIYSFPTKLSSWRHISLVSSVAYDITLSVMSATGKCIQTVIYSELSIFTHVSWFLSIITILCVCVRGPKGKSKWLQEKITKILLPKVVWDFKTEEPQRLGSIFKFVCLAPRLSFLPQALQQVGRKSFWGTRVNAGCSPCWLCDFGHVHEPLWAPVLPSVKWEDRMVLSVYLHGWEAKVVKGYEKHLLTGKSLHRRAILMESCRVEPQRAPQT